MKENNVINCHRFTFLKISLLDMQFLGCVRIRRSQCMRDSCEYSAVREQVVMLHLEGLAG